MSKKAYIGLPVHYYPNGQKDNQTVPMAAIVNRAWEGMVADIAVIPGSSGAVITKDYVPHIEDKRLKDHRGAPSELGKQRGAWDFIPEACCDNTSCCKAEPAAEEVTSEEEPKAPGRTRQARAKK